ncbi:MAG: hypothetical protein WCK47_14390 [bacterium]
MKPNDTTHGSGILNFRAQACERMGLFGKDVTHYLYLPALMAAVAIFMPPFARMFLMVVRPFRAPLDMQRLFDLPPEYLVSFFLLTAFTVGLTLSTDEVELRSRAILDNLPGSRGGYALHKGAAGVVLTAVWLTLVLAPVLVIYHNTDFWKESALTAGVFQRHGDVFELMSSNQIPVWVLYGALALALVMTGLAAGFIAGNLIGAGLLGVAASVIWLRMVTLIYPLFTTRDRDWVLLWGSLVWAALMWLIMWRRMRVPLEPRSHGSLIDTLREQAGFWRLSNKVSVCERPAQRQFHLPMLAAALAIVLCLPIVMIKDIYHEWLVLPTVVQVLAGALIGAYAWSGPERDSIRWFVYTLPVSRSRLYWSRMRALAWRVLLLVGVAVIMSLIEMVWRNAEQSRFTVGPSVNDVFRTPAMMRHMVVLLFQDFLTLAVSAFTAAAFALMQRLKIVVVALSGILTGAWTILGSVSLMAVEGMFGGSGAFQLWSYLVWMLLALFGIPLTAGWIAFCKSPMLEAPESKRGMVTVVAFVFLLVWGSLLVSMSPVQLAGGLFL